MIDRRWPVALGQVVGPVQLETPSLAVPAIGHHDLRNRRTSSIIERKGSETTWTEIIKIRGDEDSGDPPRPSFIPKGCPR